MRGLVLAAALLAGSPASATPVEDYLKARAALEKHDEGTGMLDARPGAAIVFSRYEKAVQAWTADWFDHHQPDAPRGPAAFAQAAKGLDEDLEAAVARLDPHTLLVQANHGQLGDVFILTARNGRHVVAWDIANTGKGAAIPQGSFLAAWKPARMADDCGAKEGHRQGRACGPVFGHIGSLPPDPQGHVRFYIAGTYGRAAGATGGAQFSVWTWDGATAKPALVHTYAVMADQDGPEVSGGRVRIPAKGRFKTMYACGACIGREMRIEIRLDGPEGPRLVAERSLTPELDLIDELYSRILSKRPTSTIASSLVSRQVAEEVKGAKPDDAPLGMINSWTLSRQGAREVLCLNSDGRAGARLFTFARSDGHLKVIDVQPTGSQCDGPGSRR